MEKRSKGQIIGLHQANKTAEEMAENARTWLRMVRDIIQTWKEKRGHVLKRNMKTTQGNLFANRCGK